MNNEKEKVPAAPGTENTKKKTLGSVKPQQFRDDIGILITEAIGNYLDAFEDIKVAKISNMSSSEFCFTVKSINRRRRFYNIKVDIECVERRKSNN